MASKVVYTVIKPTRVFSAQGTFDLAKKQTQKNLKYLYELGFTKNIKSEEIPKNRDGDS